MLARTTHGMTDGWMTLGPSLGNIPIEATIPLSVTLIVNHFVKLTIFVKPCYTFAKIRGCIMSIQSYMGIARVCSVFICVFLLTACVGLTPPPFPAPPTPDLEATVQVLVAAALASATHTPLADAEGTVAAGVQAIAEPLSTPTPTGTFSPTTTLLLSGTKTSIPTFTQASKIVPTTTRPSILTQKKTQTFALISTPVPTSTRPPTLTQKKTQTFARTSTPVPTATRPSTLTQKRTPTSASTPKQGPINECGEPTITIVDTLGEVEPGDALSEYPGYYIVNYESYLGPRFTLTEETIITEIGAFLDKPKYGRPFRIEIVRSSAGLPDRSDVIRRISGLSDDEYYGKYSYESVELNLTLSAGTYYALFSDSSERGGTLLTYTRKARIPYTIIYRPESSSLGRFDPETGNASSFTGSIAVRILGHPASSAVAPIIRFEQVKTAVNDIAISPSQGLIASAFSDGWARSWEIPKGEKGGFFDHGDEAVTSLAFSQDGALLITGTSDGDVFLWDPEFRKTQLFRLNAHTDSVTSVSFSADGKRVATASEDGWVRLWNVENTEELRADGSREVQFERAANTVAFSPDVDSLIMAMVIGQRVELWRYDTWERFLVLEEPSPVNSLSFHSDGLEILVGLKSGAVSLWDLENGDKLRSFQLDKPVTDLAISPNDALLAVGSEDNSVHLWNIDIWSEICNIVGHERDVTSVAFSPFDNSVLASGSRDGTVRVWKIDDEIVK